MAKERSPRKLWIKHLHDSSEKNQIQLSRNKNKSMSPQPEQNGILSNNIKKDHSVLRTFKTLK